MANERKKVPLDIQLKVLIEAGYRCAVPTCRAILAIDLHHMEEVSEGGSNESSNLLALCPTCHALHHRGNIPREAIYAWKSMLVALNAAFDRDAIDLLLFLAKPETRNLMIDGSGVLRFARLIAANLAAFELAAQNGPFFTYRVGLTEKGVHLMNAWISGKREVLIQPASSI